MKRIALIALSVLLVAAFSVPSLAASTDGYVSDGLVAFYDAEGIKAGTTTWEDLKGNNDITDVPASDTCKFTGTAYLNTATKVMFPTAIKDMLLGDEWTTEIVLGATTVTGTTWGTYLNSTNDNYSLFYRGSDKAFVLKNNGASANTRPTAALANGFDDLANTTIAVTFKAGGKAIIYINGAEVASVDAAVAITPDDFYFGHNDASKSHTTEYKAMRFYSKALSASEVASNYAKDTAPATDESKKPDESEQGNVKTGDGFVVFAVIALITAAGTVTVVKARR